jgi:putative selenium metabolism hydrolase
VIQMTDAVRNQISSFIESNSEYLASATSEFIRTPSPSGSEGAVAQVLLKALKEAGLEASVDTAGNVVGRLPGRSNVAGRKTLAFNVHLDCVPAGPSEAWRIDPYSGEIAEGRVYGRGASDTKGAWAPMILAMQAIAKSGGVDGDVLFTAVVMEELSFGIGMRNLLDSTLKGSWPDFIVLGEATDLNIALGHRGRIELELIARGKSCHASTPWKGENALYSAARAITLVEKLSRDMAVLHGHALLGRSTMTMTDIECMPGAHNVIPDLCKIYLDYRFLPHENRETILSLVKRRLDEAFLNVEAHVNGSEEKTYTGLSFKGEKYMPSYVIEPRHDLVRVATEAASTVLQQPPKTRRWDFATDGGYSMGVLGIPTIGFSPCEENLAHTVNEYVQIDYMVKAAKIYSEMILRLCGSPH